MRQSNFDKVAGGSLLLIVLIVIALGAGWIMNIVKFARLDFEAPYKAEVLRGIGIAPPIGAVMGWIPINDTPTVQRVRVVK